METIQQFETEPVREQLDYASAIPYSIRLLMLEKRLSVEAVMTLANTRSKKIRKLLEGKDENPRVDHLLEVLKAMNVSWYEFNLVNTDISKMTRTKAELFVYITGLNKDDREFIISMMDKMIEAQKNGETITQQMLEKEYEEYKKQT